MSAYYAIYPKTEEMHHFGIKRRSGRYPYGSGGRPFQGEKRGKKESEENKIKRLTETKKEAIESGNPRLVKEYAKVLTPEEYQKAIQKIQWDQNLDRLINSQPSLFTKFDSFMKKAQSVNTWINTGLSSYKYGKQLYGLLKLAVKIAL